MIQPVIEDGVRPAGRPDRCFYCGVVKGAEHTKDCVIPQRTVVLRCTIEFVKEVPVFSDKDYLHFFFNEGTHCSDNELREIIEQAECAPENTCNTCWRSEFKYVREATEQDEEEMGWREWKRRRESE